MQNELLGLAFAAGLVSAVNPCGFAMLPTYLMLVVSGTQASRPAAVARAIVATVAMAAGFLTVFALFGLLTVSTAAIIARYLPAVTVLVGVALVGFGGWLLAGRQLHVLMPAVPGNRSTPSRALGSMFGYGVAYAVASLSCTVGPFLAVTGASLRTGSVTDAVAVYIAYAVGFALVVGTLAIGAACTSTALATRIRRLMPVVSRVGGVLVILVGLYVAYYGIYELRLFHTNADPEDPVISAAGRLQGLIAGWIHEHGGWPWLIVLAALLAGVAAAGPAVRSHLWTRCGRERRRSVRPRHEGS